MKKEKICLLLQYKINQKSLRDGPFLWIDLPITMALNLPKSLRDGPLNISSNHVPIFPLIPSYIVPYLAMSS